MIERFGHSLFCDDIRSEVGGKLSFIGCYNGVMFVPSRLPFLLPKFCVHIQIKSPPHRPFSSIVARCYVPGRPRPLLEETIAAPEVKEQARLISELEHQEAASRFIVAAASLIVSPLEIREPGLIRIRAVLDDGSEELQLGALRVVAADG